MDDWLIAEELVREAAGNVGQPRIRTRIAGLAGQPTNEQWQQIRAVEALVETATVTVEFRRGDRCLGCELNDAHSGEPCQYEEGGYCVREIMEGERMDDAKKTVGEMIAAGEIGPDSPATRGEMAKLWSYASRHVDQIEDLRSALEGALERIKVLERQRELDEDYAREQAERNG